MAGAAGGSNSHLRSDSAHNKPDKDKDKKEKEKEERDEGTWETWPVSLSRLTLLSLLHF